MKTILITGFDPFNGEKINPSFEAVKLVKDEIDGILIIKKEIPTDFLRSKEVLIELIKEYRPSVVLNVGQAGGRNTISIEKQAFNLIDATIPDNAGYKPKKEKISIDGPEILFSTLPIEVIKDKLEEIGIDSYISLSAGRYVCNYVMYSMLELNEKYSFISGFIHVPFSKEQVINKNKETPYMEISLMAKALNCILEVIVKKIQQ